jgi:hypothetical protein
MQLYLILFSAYLEDGINGIEINVVASNDTTSIESTDGDLHPM